MLIAARSQQPAPGSAPRPPGQTHARPHPRPPAGSSPADHRRTRSSQSSSVDGNDLLVRLARRRRGTRCAAPRAGRSHPAAPPPAPPHPRRRTAAPPPGCCTAALGPSSCPMNHSRCCANDNGTRSGRGCGASAARAARAPRQPHRQPGRGRRLEQRPHRHLRPQHRPDPADQPDRQQRVPAQGEEVILGPDRLQRRARPRTPGTAAPPRTSAGPRPAAAPAAKSGAGSAARSSFPFGVSGSSSSTTTAAGTMYSGSRDAANSRTAAGSPAASPSAPPAGTT